MEGGSAPTGTSGQAGSLEEAGTAEDLRGTGDARREAEAAPGVSGLGQSNREAPSKRVGDRGPGVSVPASAFGAAAEQSAGSAPEGRSGADRGRRGVRIAAEGSGTVIQKNKAGGGSGTRGLNRLRSAYSSVGATLRTEISRCEWAHFLRA